MIETLEYDSMRSGGKAKLNAETLYYMHQLKKHYEDQLSKKKTAPKAVPEKKGGN